MLKESSAVNQCDKSSVLLDCAEKESNLTGEKAVSETVRAEAETIISQTFVEKSVFNYLCDLHDKITLRAVMGFLGLYVLCLLVEVAFQLDERLVRRPAASPRPFFRDSAKSVITDYYEGNDASPKVLLRRAETAIVMYYAPWSLESRQARPVFEQVARSFLNNTQLSFSAVNCFTAHGECRKSYKSHAFPIIVAYIGRIPLMYNSVIASDFLYKWVLHLLNPMVRLTSRQDVANFLADHDFPVIAYFSINVVLQRGSRYRRYLISSFSAAQYGAYCFAILIATLLNKTVYGLLEKVAFAVLTDPVTALYLRFIYDSQIRVYHWHRTIDFPTYKNYTESVILDWIREQTHDSKLLQWIVPGSNSLSKTEQFPLILKESPTVVLFTSRELLYEEKSDISIVTQTILEYFTCDGNLSGRYQIRALKREALRLQRPTRIIQDRNSCFKRDPLYRKFFRCCRNLRKAFDWLCHMCPVRKSETDDSETLCYNFTPFFKKKDKLWSSVATCGTILSHLSNDAVSTECCGVLANKSKQYLGYNGYSLSCKKYKLAQKLRYRQTSKTSMDLSPPFDNKAVLGLSCNSNSSLRFVAIDVRHYDYWLKKLSISLFDGSAVIIVNAKAESIYLMKKKFSRNNFRDFLRGYHSNLLDRHQITETVSQFSEQKLTQSPRPLVKKTTASLFQSDILDPHSSKDVVLLFSGGDWHGPSASVYYVFHTVALYFRDFSDALDFFIIDISKNDLAWPYKLDKVPAVLFFPAKRKSASTSFPVSLSYTVPNLIGFVVAHCGTSLRWHLALSSCSQLCVYRNKLRLRRHTSTLINDIGALQKVKKTMFEPRHLRLVENLMERRRAQLRVTRKLLSLMRCLNALNGLELRDRAIFMAESSLSLYSLLRFPFVRSLID